MVERDLPKVDVAGSNPVTRSKDWLSAVYTVAGERALMVSANSSITASQMP